MKWPRGTVLAAALMLGILGPPAAIAENAGTKVTHDTSRIVSIGGDVTEILYALGFGNNIAAVDATSRFPPAALDSKPSVGYMRALAAESVLSIGPTLILASRGAGPTEVVRALRNSPVTYLDIPDEPSVQGITKKIVAIARAVGETQAGTEMSRRVAQGFAANQEMSSAVEKRRNVLFVLNATGDRIIAGGADTSADAMLRLAGGDNAASGFSGYKPITHEGLISMAPDAIIVMSGGRGGSDAEALAKLPAVKLTPAGQAGRIRDIDGLYFLGFGPRTPEAVADVMKWLYPDLASQP